MMYIIIIIGILFAVLIFFAMIIYRDNIWELFIGALLMFTSIIFCLTLSELIRPTITPMDVYKGNTTLEYKVIDNIKVDSTVIWKN